MQDKELIDGRDISLSVRSCKYDIVSTKISFKNVNGFELDRK